MASRRSSRAFAVVVATTVLTVATFAVVDPCLRALLGGSKDPSWIRPGVKVLVWSDPIAEAWTVVFIPSLESGRRTIGLRRGDETAMVASYEVRPATSLSRFR